MKLEKVSRKKCFCLYSLLYLICMINACFAESSTFLHQQISELKLKVQVLWLGPNLDKFVQQLVSKYKDFRVPNQRAVMFFGWNPSILTMELDALSISFPPCDHNGFCTYQSQSLEKAVSSKLKGGAKLAYEVSLDL